jgi:hypothetical protein
VVEGAEPAPAEDTAAEAPAPRLNIIQRMAAIRDECDAIGKQDIRMEKDGKSWTIKGHTVEAVLSEIRPLFTKHGVGITPNLVERSFRGNACDVIVDWRFDALDDRTDTETVRWGGTGTDNGDKAFSKAGTNCVKEMLKKVFLVTDRDDAKEEEEKVEHKTDAEVSRARVDELKEDRRLAIEQWAKAFKSALENAKSEKVVGRLQADNAEQLNSSDLADVTRKFFFDLIQARKKTLADIAAEQTKSEPQ